MVRLSTEEEVKKNGVFMAAKLKARRWAFAAQQQPAAGNGERGRKECSVDGFELCWVQA